MKTGAVIVFVFLFRMLHGQGLDLGTISYAPTLVANLSQVYNETSGLAYYNDTVLSINDSGNEPVLHAMHRLDGQHLQSWPIANAINLDWEALALSPTSVFIGDVGNNMGNRSTLTIYRIDRSALLPTTSALAAQKLNFKYADQPVGTLPVNAHNYDCEAMFYWQDSLHLLSKNWQNLWTRHYVLPTNWQDTLVVSPRDSFYVNGLVTDASLDVQTNQIFLLGYKKEQSGLYSSFMYRFLNSNNLFFGSDYQRIELGSTLSLAQTEGLCMSGANKGFITGEQIVSVITIAPKLHAFDLNIVGLSASWEKPSIYFHGNTLYIPSVLLPEYKLVDTSGRLVVEWQLGKNHQDLTNLKPGTYLLIGPHYRRTWVKTN
ncbi:MAG: hypothetical protein NWS92_06605 [Crocinitomicaceae bacterium]|nr:hypothetical protein [Crocinitomicaceae bacterium]